MEKINNQLLSISRGEYTKNELVSILILITNELQIDTISEMARKEKKTPRGILTSNKFMKILIGKQKFAIKGLRHNNLPF